MSFVFQRRLTQILDMLEDFLFIFSHTKHDIIRMMIMIIIIIISLPKSCFSERMGRNPEEMKKERTSRKHNAKSLPTSYSSGFLGLYFSILW